MRNKIFYIAAPLIANVALTANAANVVTSADFANAWNSGAPTITVGGSPTVITGGYGIIISNTLNAFGGANMSLNSLSGAPDGEALILGQYTLAFAPGWNNGMSASISNLSIYNAANGAIFFTGNGTGAHNFTVGGTYFYGNSAGGNGGAIGVSSQIQSNAGNRYILTDNDFVNNSATNGGAVYMASNNSIYSGAPVVFNFSVIDDTGANGHFIALNNANCPHANNGGNCIGYGGAIYFMGENAQGNITNQFTATGHTYFQNYASALGGAIYNGVLNGNAPAANNFEITGGQFVQNQTGGNGGAIANQINGGNTAINIDIDGDFYSNLATGDGGAIYTAVGDQFSPYGGLITIDINGAFNGNKAKNGGVLYNYVQTGQADVETNISGQYTNNYAVGNGGAIYNTSGNNNPGTSAVNIADGTSFSGNGAIYGGAIYNSGNGVVNFNTGATGIGLTNNYAASAANGSDIYQDSATAILNIIGAGNFNINGGIGGIGTINQAGGTTFNLGSTSISGGYAGVFNNAAGATFNSYGQMFGGQNNFAGVANIMSGANSFYFNANMSDDSAMNFTSLSTNVVSVGQAAGNASAGINFTGGGALVNFIAGSSGAAWFNLMNDISNGRTNTIIFNNSDVMLGSANYTGTTDYVFYNSSLIDLAQSSANYQQYSFGNLNTDSSTAPTIALSLKVGNNQGSLMADTINVQNGGGAVNLGKVYVNDADGLITGIVRVIYGDVLDFVNGEVQNVATSNGTYAVTTVSNQYLQFDSIPAGGGGGSTSNVDPGGGTTSTTDNSGSGGDTVTTVTNPDGSSDTTINEPGQGDTTVTNNPDGSVTITTPGGTTTIPPGGSGVVDTPGGGTISVGPDGNGDTTTTITVPDGNGGDSTTTVTTDPNGGGSSVTNPDGSTAGTTTDPNGGGSTGSVTNPNNPPSLILVLNDVNALDTEATDAGLSGAVARSWQFGIDEVYYNDSDLDTMAAGTFSVYGAHARVNTSVLSGINKTNQTTMQSLFEITEDGTYFTMQDLSIINSHSDNGGAVLYMDNANSTATLTNLTVQNNSSDGNGGAVTILAGNVNSTDIVYINNSATGNGGAFYSSGAIIKHGGQFIGNHADGDGGVIYNNTSIGTTIYAGANGMEFVSDPVDGLSGMYFTGNSADGLGGAIYNAAGGVLSMASLPGADMVFTNNTDSGGTRPNDIYNDGELDFISTGGTFYIGSGIAGSGVINKYSPVVLELASTGDNSHFTGAFNQYNGIVNADTKFFGGTSTVNSGILNWNANASKEDSATLNIVAGTINISGHLRLANPSDNIGPASTLNLYSGGILDIAGGTVYLNPKDINYGPGVALQSDGYLVIAGHGLTVYSEVFTKTGGVTSIENNAVAYINDSQPGGGISGGDIIVSNATLNIQGVNLNVGGAGGHITTYGNLGVGDNALINSIDGAIQTHTFAGNFAIISEIGGLPRNIANFAVDIDAQKFVSDQFVFSGTALPGELVANGNGAEIADTLAVDAIVNLSQINLINSPTTAVVPFNILSSPNYDPNLEFTAFGGLVDTPAGLYELAALGGGDYELRLVSANPQLARGAVATNAMLMSQMQITGIMFDHVFIDSNECLTCEYAPWQFQLRQKGVWAKGYGGGDKLKFGNGLDTVNNNLYGAIAGLDFDSVRLGADKQWTWLPTLYMAYNGGNQKFNDVEMTQNGAQIGMQNTWSNGDWIGAILTYGGIYNNRIEVGNTADSVNNWFIGAGGKVAYDWRLSPERVIIQPNLLVSYNYFDSQDWSSNYGDIVIETGYLNGLNVAPGLAVITGVADAVNLFVSGAYNRNFANNSTNKAGEIYLPELKTPDWYFEYGLGVVGNIAETTTLDAKVSLRNGDNINGFIGRIGISRRF